MRLEITVHIMYCTRAVCIHVYALRIHTIIYVFEGCVFFCAGLCHSVLLSPKGGRVIRTKSMSASTPECGRG